MKNLTALNVFTVVIAGTALVIALKKESKQSQIVMSSSSQSEHILPAIKCPPGQYLIGVSSAHEGICGIIEKSAEQAPKANEPNRFVGAWTAGEICPFSADNLVAMGDCKMPYYESIKECAGDVRPSVVKISKEQKAFFPTPCLDHLSSCYVTNRKGNETQRIYMTCEAYKVISGGM